MLLEAIEELGDWGISADIRHYQEFDNQVVYLCNQINKIEQDLACIIKMCQLTCANSPNSTLKWHNSITTLGTCRDWQDNPSTPSSHDKDVLRLCARIIHVLTCYKPSAYRSRRVPYLLPDLAFMCTTGPFLPDYMARAPSSVTISVLN